MGRIQTARHDGLLRRLFSIKGGGSLLPETLGEAFPVLPLEGGPIELLKLSGWELGLGGAQATAGVGQTLGWQLFNPVDSGKIVVPTSCYFATSTAGTIFVGLTAVALGTGSVGRQRDTREGVLARTAGIVLNGNDPVVPVGSMRIFTEAQIPFKLNDSDGLAVLAPGTGFTITSSNTNMTIRYGFFWRERIAEPSELEF